MPGKKNKDQSKGDAFKEFMYNSDTGEFCGRTASSWGKSSPGPSTQAISYVKYQFKTAGNQNFRLS